MQDPAFDPGLTNQFTGVVRRIINHDGSFNVRRRGVSWRDVHPYLHLINMSWPGFLGTVFSGYLVVNLFFAGLYLTIGQNEIQGADAPTATGRFLNAFFFSSQTLTTVGYGTMSPHALGANVVAAVECLLGVFMLALGTGLLYGRVSRPSARIAFSETALIAPYQGVTALEFRVVNRRANLITELEARVMLMTVQSSDGGFKRGFEVLHLERPGILFFPLTWTVVHPIDNRSPLFGKSAADLERMQAEILIQLKGYDDTFNQTVLQRFSYRYDEIVWGARFTSAFEIDSSGTIDVFTERISNHDPAPVA